MPCMYRYVNCIVYLYNVVSSYLHVKGYSGSGKPAVYC